MNDLVKSIFYIIPPVLLLILGIAFLSGEVYAKVKVIFADILAFFGFAGKFIRKASVSNEFEGTINTVVHEYNRNFESPVLPNCKIKWVDPDDVGNTIEENVAIVCLSFDKRDHNLNFYNATLNFVQLALARKAKHYLIESSRKAIDLLTTHIILKNNRKEVLQTFNKKYSEFDQDTKKEFETLVPTNDRGLFMNLLLPEFHLYGEIIGDLPPLTEYEIETNRFLEWFKNLATRDFDDQTNLKFVSKNLKVGVILVAKTETWKNYGVSAYVKWADYYATEGYNSVYVLAKGDEGFERAGKVANVLTGNKGFDKVNRNNKIKCVSPEGNEYTVTCYALRPNRGTIEYLAWEQLKEYNASQKQIPAIINGIDKNGIKVNVFGLQFEILNSELSEMKIIDAKKIFKVEDELFLNIIEFDPDNQKATFTNKNTSSDPQKFIDTVISHKIYKTRILGVQKNSQDIQAGLRTYCDEIGANIYIPKAKASKSRFIDLQGYFKQDEIIDVEVESFSPEAANFIGKIHGLVDPWQSDFINSIEVGLTIEAVAKEINEFFITCEIQPGLECRVSQKEISWNEEECITSNFRVGHIFKGAIIIVDKERRIIYLSPRKLVKTPEFQFYENHSGVILNAEIVEIVPDMGLIIRYDDKLSTALLPWFEVGWGSVGRLDRLFNVGDIVQPIIHGFNSEKNRIMFSLKRKYKHDFDVWFPEMNPDKIFEGKVQGHFDGSVHIELNSGDLIVQAIIHKSQVSNIARINNEDLNSYFPIGVTFSFAIQSVEEKFKVVNLTRRDWLNSNFQSVDYGIIYLMAYVKENHFKSYLYSNEIEGWIQIPTKSIKIGDSMEVILLASGSKEFEIS